jgi:Domain of unknown function (DUF4440)
MTPASDLTKEVLEDLTAIERTLWENNAEIYEDTYLPGAVLIFPEVGRIDLKTAVEAIRQENAEGRAWAEVQFDDVDVRWLVSDVAALISYKATARWNYESAASQWLCASVYVREEGTWRVGFHQQTAVEGKSVSA